MVTVPGFKMVIALPVTEAIVGSELVKKMGSVEVVVADKLNAASPNTLDGRELKVMVWDFLSSTKGLDQTPKSKVPAKTSLTPTTNWLAMVMLDSPSFTEIQSDPLLYERNKPLSVPTKTILPPIDNEVMLAIVDPILIGDQLTPLLFEYDILLFPTPN